MDKPKGYEHLSWSVIRAINNTCSTPASRAAVQCLCASGKPQEVCKDQPQCNRKATLGPAD